MNELEGKLFKAVKHVLGRICEDERVAYQLGFATESLRLLVDGYAAATNQPVENVQKEVEEALGKLPLKEYGERLDRGMERVTEKEEGKNAGKGEEIWERSDGLCVEEFVDQVFAMAHEMLPGGKVVLQFNPEANPTPIVRVGLSNKGDQRRLLLVTY